MFEVRASQMDFSPYTSTAETHEFERRIKDLYPEIKVRRSGRDGFTVFALDGRGGAVGIIEAPHLGEFVKNDLDRQRREYQKKTAADRWAARQAQEDAATRATIARPDAVQEALERQCAVIERETRYDPAPCGYAVDPHIFVPGSAQEDEPVMEELEAA